MCNVCEGKTDMQSQITTMSIKGNKLTIDYDAFSTDSSFREEIEINFCPMCRKDLHQETNEN